MSFSFPPRGLSTKGKCILLSFHNSYVRELECLPFSISKSPTESKMKKEDDEAPKFFFLLFFFVCVRSNS